MDIRTTEGAADGASAAGRPFVCTAPTDVLTHLGSDRTGVAYVFVLGTGRCGSTLVEEVLCRHPGVGFISNVEDRFSPPLRLTRWTGWLYRHLPDAATLSGPKRFAPTEAYAALEREVSPMLSTPFRDLTAGDAGPWMASRLERFFEQRARAQSAPVFLHKFTGWPRALFLHRVFPRARFIHIVRDGRAVANSLLQMPWWRGYGGPERWQFGPLPPPLAAQWEEAGRSFAVLAALQWRMLIEAYDRAREALPGECWLEVRYEDLAARPEEAFREMVGFCGLEWSEGFARGFARHRFAVSRIDAFRRDLDPEEVDRMTAAISQALASHGYSAD